MAGIEYGRLMKDIPVERFVGDGGPGNDQGATMHPGQRYTRTRAGSILMLWTCVPIWSA